VEIRLSVTKNHYRRGEIRVVVHDRGEFLVDVIDSSARCSHPNAGATQNLSI